MLASHGFDITINGPPNISSGQPLLKTKCLSSSSRKRQTSYCKGTFCRVRAELPRDLIRARRLKQQGLIASGITLASAVALSAALGVQLPSVPDWTPWALTAAVGAPVAVLAGGRALFGDRLQIEFHMGRLYIQFGVPPADGVPLTDGAVEVRPSEGKGNGAFATKLILAHTFLGDYEGELLDEVAYWQRYPTGVADYCMGIDREWTIDGRELAKDTTRFNPCHINHSSSRHNVTRRCSRAERRVSFYAAHNIQPGEELLLDYGKLYWTGRQEQELD